MAAKRVTMNMKGTRPIASGVGPKRVPPAKRVQGMVSNLPAPSQPPAAKRLPKK